MDYGRLVEVILEFEACELRRCLNVFINNDLIPEDMESFFVILGETPGLSGRITLEPTEAEIAIIDANGKLYRCEIYVTLYFSLLLAAKVDFFCV